MPVLNGLNSAAFVAAPSAPRPSGGTEAAAAAAPSTTLPSVIDGTPVRVVVLSLSAAMGLWALHMAGFRFNVGVSN